MQKLVPAAAIIEGEAFAPFSQIQNAFHYAVNNGAKIINCSWKIGNRSMMISEGIQYARDHGVLVVCGAGNDGRNVDRGFPVDYPTDCTHDNILSCASTDRYDHLDINGLSNYTCPTSELVSSYGPTSVDIAAPGCDFCADYPDAPSCGHSGTSVASPIVAGAAALLWQQNPTWTYLQIKNRLMRST